MQVKGPLRFVVLIGVVSLFGDMTYEAARSLNGPYLAHLGASAAAVGVIADLGEFIGYGLRLVSGYISDRTGKYWFITILGYTLNLLAVPLLALAGHWMIAAMLMVTERLGKAIRTPARDVMLSHAGKAMGSGWAFGLHEAMDQIGAVTGPLQYNQFSEKVNAGFGLQIFYMLIKHRVGTHFIVFLICLPDNT